MRKLLLSALSVLFCAFVAAAEATDYRARANWVIRETEKPDTEFDVFYVYPTLFSDAKHPYMDWKNDSKLRDKTERFVKAQTGIFGPRARVFAPYVRQLDYLRVVSAWAPGRDWRNAPKLEPGIEDTLQAFRHYLEHFNEGRPYILFGHSQGSMDLYLVMKRTKLAAPAAGFVAAYLIGLPRLGAEEIAADLAGCGIRPASGAEDTGVVIGWNTQSPAARNPGFTGNGTYCINPLNWRTDGTSAPKSANAEAFFYDYRDRTYRSVPRFCGARIDVKTGALLVDLPENSRYDAKGFMGRGVFHMNDVWFFAGNLRENAVLRVKAWRQKYGGKGE